MTPWQPARAVVAHPAAEPPPAPPRLGVIWSLLTVNVLGFIGTPIVPIPHTVGLLLTMPALAVALVLALLRNPRLQIRPNAFLTILTVLAVTSLASSLRFESGFGALFRSGRMLTFLATLWLLTPWWRGDLLFVRYHVRILCAVLTTALLGLAVAPGTAMNGPSGNRLHNVIWPMPPPHVGQYAAVACGLVITMWVAGVVRARTVAAIVPATFGVLLLTHTRTALAGLVIGALVAALSLVATTPRARRFVSWVVIGGGLGALVLGPFVVRWLARGQDSEQITSLTGRGHVWSALLELPRTRAEALLGVGLGDKSFGGLAIDNAWLTNYHEQGLIGVGLVALAYLAMLFAAAARPPSPARACALFLITYSIAVSFTEVGLGDASSYALHLAVAASLLQPGEPAGPRARAGPGTKEGTP